MSTRTADCRELHSQALPATDTETHMERMCIMLQIVAQLDRKKISRDKDYEGHLMVSIKAEDKDFQRTPVEAILVLDVSGSMAGMTAGGQSKLEAVKLTATKLVKNLTEKDEVAIVTFSGNIEVLQARINGGNKEAIYRAIASLRPLDSTNLSGGLLEGLKQVNKEFSGVKRVMLLSDGQANAGVFGREALVNLVKDQVKDGVTLSTFAFGNDADQETMADMAKAGQGNFYYIKDGRDMDDVFARELGGIISCLAQNIKVKIKPSGDNKILEVLNDFTVTDEKGTAVIGADDAYVGENKHVVLKMNVIKPDGKVKDRPFSVAHVEVSYDGLKSKKVEKHELNVKVEFVKDSEADEKPVMEVAEQVAFLTAARAQLKAVELANAGNYAGAQAEIKTAGIFLNQMAHEGSTCAAEAERVLLASHAMYDPQNYSMDFANATKGTARSATRYKAGGACGQSIGNLAGQHSNKAQQSMLRAFNEPQVQPHVQAPNLAAQIQAAVAGQVVVPQVTLAAKGFAKKRVKKS